MTPEDLALIKKYYDPLNVRTWFYYPIVMPLLEGQGPASDAECDEITWEVWDWFCTTYASFNNLPDAINEALRLNSKLLEEK
jgi:hypothetical protein